MLKDLPLERLHLDLAKNEQLSDGGVEARTLEGRNDQTGGRDPDRTGRRIGTCETDSIVVTEARTVLLYNIYIYASLSLNTLLGRRASVWHRDTSLFLGVLGTICGAMLTICCINA